MGQSSDPHLQAILGELGGQTRPLLISKSSDLGPAVFGADMLSDHRRAILRSLPSSPVDLSEAAQLAWTDYLEGWMADPSIQWLASLADVRWADNKINQLRLAQRLNIPFPQTVVPRTIGDLEDALGAQFVAKPLGSGVSRRSGSLRIFYSRLVHVSDVRADELARAPILAQQYLKARTHLRVVTVAGKVWIAALDARGLPLDWRTAAPSQRRGWKSYCRRDDIEQLSLHLAESAHLGYTSQDWIEDEDGKSWFVDLNPCGAWLFLPDAISQQITRSLAKWLLADYS